MEYGKKICEKLKGIRMEVARANGIPYQPAECNHEGDCAGTCPQCEAEVRYLEHKLGLKRVVGKAAFIGMAVGVAVAVESCGFRVSGMLMNQKDEADTTAVAADANAATTIDMPVDGK